VNCAARPAAPVHPTARPSRLLPLLVLLLVLAACGSGKKNNNGGQVQNGRIATPTPALSAQDLLNAADQTTEALQSFHFVLTHENGSTPIANNISMTKADGDVLKPDRFKATVTGTLSGFTVNAKVINVGDQVWLNLAGDKYVPLPNGVGASAILDPNNGVLKALKGVKNPQIAGHEKLNGVDTTIVAGDVDAGDLTALAQNAQAGKTVKGRAWIGDADHRLYRLRIDGPLNDQEPANIARIIDLSQFNEKLDIQPPSP
jgi:hypothetical protein